jgi:hypothetical protein
MKLQDYETGQPRNMRNTRKANYAGPPQWPLRRTGELLAGDIRAGRVRGNANEAVNQQLTPQRTVDDPSLDKRLAVAEA